mmetsp:Transcript_114138/g.295562  ORF Transcript_114138/g.295562 Transcript_114138/m.295562 type:complete len:91 (+) Transcript_114138:306-578(+)
MQCGLYALATVQSRAVVKPDEPLRLVKMEFSVRGILVAKLGSRARSCGSIELEMHARLLLHCLDLQIASLQLLEQTNGICSFSRRTQETL